MGNKYKCLFGFLYLGFILHLGTVALRSCSSCLHSKPQLSLGTNQGEASHENGGEGRHMRLRAHERRLSSAVLDFGPAALALSL